MNDVSTRYDLGYLTDAERLWIWRRRQLSRNGRTFGRAGPAMTQTEAAATIGVSYSSYRAIEAGLGARVLAAEVAAAAEPIEGLVPTQAELCAAARRRSGELLVDVYESLGVSRPWYLRLEREADPRVVAFWEERGFRFP
jgi:hypothetical protein